MTATPAARRLLDQLADKNYTLAGERDTESSAMIYRLRLTIHDEVTRTTTIPPALVAQMCSAKQLTASIDPKPRGFCARIKYAAVVNG